MAATMSPSRNTRLLPPFVLGLDEESVPSTLLGATDPDGAHEAICTKHARLGAPWRPLSNPLWPMTVQKAIANLPALAQDILAAAVRLKHPLLLADDEIASIKLCARKSRQTKQNHCVDAGGPQAVQSSQDPEAAHNAPSHLTQAEQKSVNQCSALRLAYAALLAARLPSHDWVLEGSRVSPPAAILALSFLFARRMTSEGAHSLRLRDVRLYQLALGITQTGAPDDVRLAGAVHANETPKQINVKLKNYERNFLTQFHYDLAVAPELVVAALAEIRRLPDNPLPYCERRFARRLFLEAGADVYCPVNQYLVRASLPKRERVVLRASVPPAQCLLFPSLELYAVGRLRALPAGQISAQSLQPLTESTQETVCRRSQDISTHAAKAQTTKPAIHDDMALVTQQSLVMLRRTDGAGATRKTSVPVSKRSEVDADMLAKTQKDEQLLSVPAGL